MNKRQLQILEMISNGEKMEVSEIATKCDVSTVTIRKDLDYLENQELLKREHGFAVIKNVDNINYRLAVNYSDKQVIAQKAAQIVEPNETVIIESGSSCTLLALEIAKRDQNNTIITNSTFIARYLKDYPKTKILLLGGEYQHSSEAVIGSLVGSFIKNFNTDKIFIGTDGISKQFGVTGSDYDRTETVKTMSNYAKNVYVLTQSYKIGESSSYTIFQNDEVEHVFVDDKISQAQKDYLNELNIQFS